MSIITLTEEEKSFLMEAVKISQENVTKNSGGPFGALVVLENEIIGKGSNLVTAGFDPTAHAEVVAIRAACKHIGDFQLTDAVLYTSCEPCPMCLGAAYWARVKKIIYAADRVDAAQAGFDDEWLYQEMKVSLPERKIPMVQGVREEAIKVFKQWVDNPNKIPY